MVKNSTLQKMIELNEDVLNKQIAEKSKFEMLISNIKRSIDLINNSLMAEQLKVNNEDINMIRSFSKYREICAVKIKLLQNELILKENALDNLKLVIKETYIEKEKFNLLLQKNLIKKQKELELREVKIMDEINVRNFITSQGI